MKKREELELILKLIRKYNLPLSPILEFAIKEKIDEYPEKEKTAVITNNRLAEEDVVAGNEETNNDISAESLSDELRIVDYGVRTIAVVGNTKPHKDALKSIGGYFVLRTQWGPAWVFRSKKRRVVQAYLDGDTSVITREDEEDDETQKKRTARYIIRVKYPDGRVFDSNLVWETLVDVIKYAGPEKVKQLNIVCMGDNLVSTRLNENPIYRSAQKDIGQGLYVCTYSSTDIKFKQIVRINLDCRLGLEVEKIYIDKNEESQTRSSEETPDRKETNIKDKKSLNKRRLVHETDIGIAPKEDRRIGYTVRLLPSQLTGEIVRVKSDAKGKKKLMVKTTNGYMVEIDDLPYLYEVLKRN